MSGICSASAERAGGWGDRNQLRGVQQSVGEVLVGSGPSVGSGVRAAGGVLWLSVFILKIEF